jgi:TolB-like protein/DNA-binding winged helix-turn-helix (wHTH) protein/Flp pilus assembly protein TadD
MERLQQHTSVWRFGTYEVDLDSGELRKSGIRIRVQQQPLKLLEILLKHPGEVVTREDLRARIWPDESFGDFDQAVNVAIAKLRGALGDSADNPRFIETIPRRGYRFVAEVAVVQRDSGRAKLAQETPATAGTHDLVPAVAEQAMFTRLRGPLSWKIIGLSVVLLTIVVVAVIRWRKHSLANASPTSPIMSLAVLPLENLSGDAENYFADGMTDEIITDLAQIGALRVISRTSVMPYKGARKSLPLVARELNVDAIVEGTVLRSGNQVRITAQLIQASVDKHLWAQSYQGDLRNTLSLQKQVASAIAEQIRIELTPHERAVLKNAKAVDPEAYEDYLKGRFFFNKRNSREKAQEYFQRAIEKDPNYPSPYTGLADIYQLSDNPHLARQSVQKALDLDNELAEAHNSLAELLYRFDRDWLGAGREFKRAIELNPNYAPAHHWYSMYLAFVGRRQQALAEAQKAHELDPLSPVVGANLAKILQENGQYDKAIDQAKKTLELEPNSAVTHVVLGIVYEDKKMYADAIGEYKTGLQLGGAPGEIRGLLGYVYAATGDIGNAGKMIRELKMLWPGHAHAALDLAVVYSGLGQNDQALYWLGKASEADVGDLIAVGQNPHFAALRTDQRFQAFVKQLGAPQ